MLEVGVAYSVWTGIGVELHPVDALARAQHRAWMEFGSAILGELWGLETTTDPAPVLVVTAKDEVALFESNVICEYIEETQGGANTASTRLNALPAKNGPALSAASTRANFAARAWRLLSKVAAGTFVMGFVLFGEALSAMKVAGIVLVLMGIAALKLA